MDEAAISRSKGEAKLTGKWVIALALAAALTSPGAQAAQLLVLHGWSSPAEIAAVNVLKRQVEGHGNSWINLVIPHDNGSNVDVLDLIAGGNSPNLFLEPNPDIYRALHAKGLMLSPQALFEQTGALQHFPKAVLEAITIDGTILKVPNTIHADGMIYFNRDVAAKAGVDPSQWQSFDAMFADFAKVRAAGFMPLALGAEQWQVGYLTHDLVAAIGGAALYRQLYATEPDPEAFDDPALLQVFATLRQFAQATDPGAAGRSWNAATGMVISGQALLQVQGDWMKGEWHAAGKTLADFGCVELPGARGMVFSIDSWGLLGGTAPDVAKAELDFAAITVDPAVQTAFAAAKGSTPVRLDVDPAAIDQCSAQVLRDLDRPGFAVVTPNLMATPEWRARIWDVAFAFWNTPDETPEEAVEALRKALATLPEQAVAKP